MSGGRRFELRQHLGEGTFGTVYLADMVSLGGFRTRVALKVLNAQWSGESDAGRRLRDEARLLGHLDHRNIVRVFDLVRVDGRWAVVMEALKGADLENVLIVMAEQGETMSPRAALELVRQMALGLDAALHGEGHDGQPLHVVHRDIKPSNVILTTHGDVKLLDFGIAGSNVAGREAATSRIGYGSVPYMSPERLRGLEAEEAGDVYSVGAMLWELLVGEPYGRAEPGRLEHAEQARSRDSALRSALGDDPQADTLISLVTAMMAFRPDDRPSIEDVLRRVRELLPQARGRSLLAVAEAHVPAARGRVETRDADGVLSEEASGDGTAVPAAGARGKTITVDDFEPNDPPSNSTLVAPEAFDEPVAVPTPAPAPSPSPTRSEPPPVSTATEPPPRDGPPMGLIAGAIVALLVVGGGAFWFMGGGGEDPAPAPAPTVEAPVAVTPPPAPVEDPTAEDPTAEDPTAEDPTAVDPAAEDPSPEDGSADAAPEAAPASTPAASTPAASSPAASTPAAAPPRAAAPEPEPEPEPEGPVERVRMIKVVAPDASEVRAVCGDRDGTGSSSLVVRDAPKGRCSVTATVGGASLRGSLTVSGPAAFTCTASGSELTCR